MITSIGLNKIANSIIALINKGQVTVDGATKDVDLFKTSIDKDTVKIYLLLDDTFTGRIDHKCLLDKDNNIIFENAISICKDSSRGLLIVFSIKISEVMS